MVTIIDVANYAGVSKSTVSTVLNNGPHVKEETRLRVEEAVKALGYVCNNNARGLRKRETKCLGVIIAVESRDIHTYEFNFEVGQFGYAVANGIPDGLADSDYGLITEQYCPREMAEELPTIIKNARVDGVFLVGSLFDGVFLKKLQDLNLPAVGVGTNYDGIDCVFPDIAKGMRLQVEELVRNGVREIAMVNCPPEFANAKMRVLGWNQAIMELGDKLKNTWEIQYGRRRLSGHKSPLGVRCAAGRTCNGPRGHRAGCYAVFIRAGHPHTGRYFCNLLRNICLGWILYPAAYIRQYQKRRDGRNCCPDAFEADRRSKFAPPEAHHRS